MINYLLMIGGITLLTIDIYIITLINKLMKLITLDEYKKIKFPERKRKRKGKDPFKPAQCSHMNLLNTQSYEKLVSMKPEDIAIFRAEEFKNKLDIHDLLLKIHRSCERRYKSQWANADEVVVTRTK